MTRIAILILVLVGAGCEGTPFVKATDGPAAAKACTLVGCVPSISTEARLNKSLPAKIRIEYNDTTVFDDCESLPESFEVMASRKPDGSGVKVEELLVKLAAGEDLPESVDVSVFGRASCDARESVLYVAEEAPVTYETFYPNGHDCSGECQIGRVELIQ